jgi:hypothetical protein
MRKQVVILGIVLILICVGLSGCTYDDSGDKTNGGEFEIFNVRMLSDKMKVYEIETVVADVQNNGTESGSFDCELKIDGIVKYVKEVNLNPGELSSVNFEISFSETGFYNLTLGPYTTLIEVYSDSEDEDPYDLLYIGPQPPLKAKPKWEMRLYGKENKLKVEWSCDEGVKIELYEIIFSGYQRFGSKFIDERWISKSSTDEHVSTFSLDFLYSCDSFKETIDSTIIELRILDINENIIYREERLFESGKIRIEFTGNYQTNTNFNVFYYDGDFPVYGEDFELYADGELIELTGQFYYNYNGFYDNEGYYDEDEVLYHKPIEPGPRLIKIIIYDGCGEISYIHEEQVVYSG